MVSKGNHPQMAQQFRFVKHHNLARLIFHDFLYFLVMVLSPQAFARPWHPSTGKKQTKNIIPSGLQNKMTGRAIPLCTYINTYIYMIHNVHDIIHIYGYHTDTHIYVYIYVYTHNIIRSHTCREEDIPKKQIRCDVTYQQSWKPDSNPRSAPWPPTFLVPDGT